MAILLWVGENDYGIAQQLEALKRKLHPDWIAFNYHAFSPFALTDALAAARTPPVMDKRKVIVIKTCNFSQVVQFGEPQWQELQSIDQLPDTTTVVFTAVAIDRRLKIVKHLLKSATLKEFPLISPWRTDLIAGVIAAQAKAMQLSLDRECVNYLAEAIGNDQTRAAAELKETASVCPRQAADAGSSAGIGSLPDSDQFAIGGSHSQGRCRPNAESAGCLAIAGRATDRHLVHAHYPVSHLALGQKCDF